jgi:hypothetical protein
MEKYSEKEKIFTPTGFNHELGILSGYLITISKSSISMMRPLFSTKKRMK